MSEMAEYIHLGFRHIVDVEAMDHILFLLALAAIYRLRDVRSALWVITAFTVGHSATLALAATGLVRFPVPVIEFLIPITIVATCVENLIASRGDDASGPRWRRALLAGAFGLVHGAGFAGYLQGLFVEHIALPLFGFNLGIELGQLVVLSAAAVLLAGVDRALAHLRLARPGWPVLRLRVAGLSLVVLIVASRWAMQRSPW